MTGLIVQGAACPQAGYRFPATRAKRITTIVARHKAMDSTHFSHLHNLHCLNQLYQKDKKMPVFITGIFLFAFLL